MGGGTRAPEGTIAEGTFRAIADALPKATFVNASDLLQEARGQKSDEEVAVLQRSVDLIERAIDAMAATAQPGVPDYFVWAETMHALFARGSELSVHFNWIAAPIPGRTMTRPTGRPLEKGDVIVTEIESSVIGYRAQQVRPVAVHAADPAYLELSKVHGELYPRLLAAFSPGMTVRELLTRTFAIGAEQRAQHGVSKDAKTSLIIHGRGLGDDYPLLVTNLDGRPSARTERMLDYVFPDNGVYILKPTIASADDRYHFIWGDTVHVGPKGARRMGHAPHGLVISQPRAVDWPRDVTVYS
jgi:Xaa-Pro aminopeptidase